MAYETFNKSGKTTHKAFGTEKSPSAGNPGQTNYSKGGGVPNYSSYKNNVKSASGAKGGAASSTFPKGKGEKFGTGK